MLFDGHVKCLAHGQYSACYVEGWKDVLPKAKSLKEGASIVVDDEYIILADYGVPTLSVYRKLSHLSLLLEDSLPLNPHHRITVSWW